MLEALITIARQLRKELKDRRELRDLLDQDDRILRDIGLTRGDVQTALSRPLSIGARREAQRLSRIAFYLDGERFPRG